jgi:hypothetical protein
MVQGIFNWVVASVQGAGSWAYDAIATTTVYVINLVK